MTQTNKPITSETDSQAKSTVSLALPSLFGCSRSGVRSNARISDKYWFRHPTNDYALGFSSSSLWTFWQDCQIDQDAESVRYDLRILHKVLLPINKYSSFIVMKSNPQAHFLSNTPFLGKEWSGLFISQLKHFSIRTLKETTLFYRLFVMVFYGAPVKGFNKLS